MYISSIFRTILFALAIAVSPLFVVPQSLAAEITELLNGQAYKWQGQVVDVGPLKKFYKSRHSRRVWTDKTGLNEAGKGLVLQLKKAAEDGLITSDYYRKFPAKIKTEDLARADMYLSQALWKFGRDLFSGRTTPSVSDPDIIISRKKFNIEKWLNSAVRRGAAYLLDSIRPPHKQYAALRKQLAKTKKKSRRHKIIVNMERWRWLPRDMGKRHILVNQAAFEVYIREKEKIVDRRKVVIGRTFHKTPMFSHVLKYAEFNPTWVIPRIIASKEYLPKLRKNRRYLETRGYKIYDSWEKDAKELDVKKVNWSKVSSRDFPYRIVQQPGNKNALGKVKFMFPNKFNVYLHDTPAKKLFTHSSRAYSYGCIRVQKPLDFATKVFKSERLTQSKIAKILASEETTVIKKRKTMQIHLTYFTLWMEANGKMKSYKDVYGRDRMVSKILF